MSSHRLLRLLKADAPYANRVKAIAPASLIGYWPLDDASGTTARDLSGIGQSAAYAGSGVTYGATGPAGANAVTMSGTDTYVNITTTTNTFDTLWSGDTFSMVAWGKVDGSSRWTDVTTYRYLSHVRATDATYYAVMAGRSTTNHQIEWRRRVGGPIVSITHTFSPAGPTDWFCMGMTCNAALPELRAYLWDSTGGWRKISTSTSANLTTWAGNAPVEGTTVLGAGSLTLQEWIGGLAGCAFWNATLTDEQMRQAMVPV